MPTTQLQKRITDLTAVTSVSANDVIPIVPYGATTTFKVPVSLLTTNLTSYLTTNFAPLNAPTFTGAINGVTPSVGNNSTLIPTTAWVNTAITNATAAPSWTSLNLNTGWSNFGGAYPPLRYRVMPNNTVFIDGVIRCSSFPTGGTGVSAITTLPTAARPTDYTRTSPLLQANNSTTIFFPRLDLNTSGVLSVYIYSDYIGTSPSAIDALYVNFSYIL